MPPRASESLGGATGLITETNDCLVPMSMPSWVSAVNSKMADEACESPASRIAAESLS